MIANSITYIFENINYICCVAEDVQTKRETNVNDRLCSLCLGVEKSVVSSFIYIFYFKVFLSFIFKYTFVKIETKWMWILFLRQANIFQKLMGLIYCKSLLQNNVSFPGFGELLELPSMCHRSCVYIVYLVQLPLFLNDIVE